MYGPYKCGHYIVAKVIYVLAWISAIAFWWTSWKGTMVWSMDSSAWFNSVVVFSLLSFGAVLSGCRRHHMMAHQMMKDGGYCPACEGKGGEHTHGEHKHM